MRRGNHPQKYRSDGCSVNNKFASRSIYTLNYIDLSNICPVHGRMPPRSTFKMR